MVLIADLISNSQHQFNFWIHRILPQLRKKTGVISVGAAVILTLLYNTLQKFNRPPKQLRHLPYISYFTFLKYSFRDALFETFSKEMTMPLVRSNGIYMRPTVEGWSVQVANPIAVKQILLKPESSFPKANSNVGTPDTLIHKFIGGPNIVLLSGKDWKRHRKIANPAFQRSMPVKTFGHLTSKMYQAMEDLGTDTIDVFDLFERWTLDAIGITGFDFDFNALGDRNNKWVNYYDSVKGGMSNPFYIFFPSFDTKFVRFIKRRKQIHDNLEKFLANIDMMIEQKRKQVHEKAHTVRDEDKDLLTLMIESGLSEGEDKLSDEELRSNLCIFFLAGHDTTANTLAFALYELAKNPELQEKARKEALEILGDATEDVIPTIEQAKQMTYINMVIKETMRRHTPVYSTTNRVALEDLELAGTFIPKGSELSVDIYNLHHNPDVWHDPYQFKPERFVPGGEADQHQGIGWVPFSNGGRQCIGMNFSLAEQRVVLSMMRK
ncbi:cytochrome P450 [Choanephora cucurbitarum]|nr:cytochrome P450 [Choanephora cucurbitarum]